MPAIKFSTEPTSSKSELAYLKLKYAFAVKNSLKYVQYYGQELSLKYVKRVIDKGNEILETGHGQTVIKIHRN